MSSYFNSSSEFDIIALSCAKNRVLEIYLLVVVLFRLLHFLHICCVVKKEIGTSNYGDRL